jgi:uncharacterized protein YqjF (DUF2071 family)
MAIRNPVAIETTQGSRAKPVFLSAEWRDLVMLNYEVDPALLKPYLPSGTVLDSFAGKTYVSLVGFRFCRTKMLGFFSIPFHVNFLEINLRFYVRRGNGNEERRGVVFISEVVPRHAIATTARLLYGENYICLPMRHRVATEGLKKIAEYQWQIAGQWCTLLAKGIGAPFPAVCGSLEQFITEHYWGYSRQKNGNSLEYQVTHPSWLVRTATEAGFHGDASALYGSEFSAILQRRPDCAFVADGSRVIVHKGERIV